MFVAASSTRNVSRFQRAAPDVPTIEIDEIGLNLRAAGTTFSYINGLPSRSGTRASLVASTHRAEMSWSPYSICTGPADEDHLIALVRECLRAGGHDATTRADAIAAVPKEVQAAVASFVGSVEGSVSTRRAAFIAPTPMASAPWQGRVAHGRNAARLEQTAQEREL